MMPSMSRRLALLIVATAATIALCWIGVTLLKGSGLGGFGFGEASEPANGSRTAWPTAAMTILGVVASLLVDLLRAQDQEHRVNFANLVDGLLRPQTFIALCVSPVVLFGALLAVQGKELGPAVYLAAFQNGFFWQKVLDRRPAAKSPAAVPEPPSTSKA